MRQINLWSAWNQGESSEVSLQISRAIVKSLNPQIAVFDCFPTPEFVTAVVESKVPIVLCLREMRDIRSYLREVSDLLPRVSLVLIPHDEGAFELPEQLKEKSCFAGLIARPISDRRVRSSDPDHPKIVVSGGGGGYPGTVRLYNLALDALTVLRTAYPRLNAHLITGPLFVEWRDLELVRGVVVKPFEADLPGAFAAADLVICQAGYSMVVELQQTGTKAILVSAERKWDDQLVRAQNAARLSQQFRTFHGSTCVDLAQLASEFLQERIAVDGCHFEGANRAAERLHSILEELGG